LELLRVRVTYSSAPRYKKQPAMTDKQKNFTEVLDNLMFAQLVKKFLALHGTRWFIIVLARACDWTLTFI
jgi:hypothetical protein